jgi:putative peptidoglycan lipid II flippase
MIMVSVMLSRVLGFFRTALIPARMGGFNDVVDAYNAAFQIPDLMYGLLVGGAIAASLIPMLTGYVERKREKEGWQVVGTYINVIMIVMLALVILGVVFAPFLMKLILREASAGKIDLAVSLTRTLMPIAFFMMLSGFCNGIMNSYSRFAVAAFGPCVYNAATVISILLFSNSNEAANYGANKVVFAIVVCSILYFLLQFAFTIRHLKFYRPKLSMGHPDFRKMINLALPTLLTSAFIQINYIVSKSFSSIYGEGSLSALEVAGKTWQMPLGIIAQAVGVAILPSLSALYATGKFDKLGEKLNSALRFVLFLAVPSAMGLAIISKPTIQLLFNWGSLTEAGVMLAAAMLTFYSISVVTQSINTIMNRAYYSTKNSFLPMVAGSFGIVVNYLLAWAITKGTGLGAEGVALAYSIATVSITIALLLWFNRRIKGFKFINSPGFIIKTVVSVVVMGVSVFLSDRFLMPLLFGNTIMDIGKFSQVLWVLIDVAAGVAMYGIVSYFLKIDEMRQITHGILNKMKSIVNN